MKILSFPEPEQPPRATDIEGRNLLIGEGSHEAQFFKALLADMSIDNIQLGYYCGKNKLSLFLRTLKTLPRFRDLAHLGITCDADDSHDAAFASVCGALRNEVFVVPGEPGEFAVGSVDTGAFIIPDNAGPGNMETLCLRSVESDPAMQCVDMFFDCVLDKADHSPKEDKLDKARAHAYLASMPEPDKHTGLGALAGYWDLNSRALDPLKEFISTLSGL